MQVTPPRPGGAAAGGRSPRRTRTGWTYHVIGLSGEARLVARGGIRSANPLVHTFIVQRRDGRQQLLRILLLLITNRAEQTLAMRPQLGHECWIRQLPPPALPHPSPR